MRIEMIMDMVNKVLRIVLVMIEEVGFGVLVDLILWFIVLL